MKSIDVMLLFSNETELDYEEEIETYKVTKVAIDDNDYIDMYDIKTVDGEKI